MFALLVLEHADIMLLERRLRPGPSGVAGSGTLVAGDAFWRLDLCVCLCDGTCRRRTRQECVVGSDAFAVQ